MTNCTCTVTECKHNDDHCCCKSEILVNADSKNDCSCGCTCCASFDQKTFDSFKNSTQTPDRACKSLCTFNCDCNPENSWKIIKGAEAPLSCVFVIIWPETLHILYDCRIVHLFH